MFSEDSLSVLRLAKKYVEISKRSRKMDVAKADLKYSKYRLNMLSPEKRKLSFGSWPQTSLFTDTGIIDGSNHFWATWVTSAPIPRRGPHTHNDAEQLAFIGSDPNNMRDLGCEVELYIGPNQVSQFNPALYYDTE
jgi:hypothetical protein